jgi:hypothetical protein
MSDYRIHPNRLLPFAHDFTTHPNRLMPFAFALAPVSLEDRRKAGAWANATPIAGLPGSRIDCDLRIIRWEDYGQLSEYGWEIDHIVAKAAGGCDDLSNLRARHWEGNRRAGGLVGALLK